MALLKRIEIRGYRSIHATSLELRRLNVLIGANGSGKSNFVSFFTMLNEMIHGRLQEHVGKTGRAQAALHFGPKVTPQLESRLEFETKDGTPWYHLELAHAAGDALVFAKESLRDTPLGGGHQESQLCDAANGGVQEARVVVHFLGQCRVYHFHDTSPTARGRQACYLHDNRWLWPDAGNLAAMLYAYKQRHEVVYRRIVSTVRKVLPEFDDFDLEPSRLNPNDILLNWRKKGRDYLFGPHQLSDGTLRAAAILTLFLQPKNDLPGVIILDEPELGLHPHALEIVAGVMRAASETTQVVVATQSLPFLNYFEPSEIVTVSCREGRSSFRRLETEGLKDWLEDYSVGELWQRNVLGGGPLP